MSAYRSSKDAVTVTSGEGNVMTCPFWNGAMVTSILIGPHALHSNETLVQVSGACIHGYEDGSGTAPKGWLMGGCP